jgi:hypothetical protein
MTKDEVMYNVQLCDVVYKDQKDIDFNSLGLTSVKWIDDKKSDTQAFGSSEERQVRRTLRTMHPSIRFLSLILVIRYTLGSYLLGML